MHLIQPYFILFAANDFKLKTLAKGPPWNRATKYLHSFLCEQKMFEKQQHYTTPKWVTVIAALEV